MQADRAIDATTPKVSVTMWSTFWKKRYSSRARAMEASPPPRTRPAAAMRPTTQAASDAKTTAALRHRPPVATVITGESRGDREGVGEADRLLEGLVLGQGPVARRGERDGGEPGGRDQREADEAVHEAASTWDNCRSPEHSRPDRAGKPFAASLTGRSVRESG